MNYIRFQLQFYLHYILYFSPHISSKLVTVFLWWYGHGHYHMISKNFHWKIFIAVKWHLLSITSNRLQFRQFSIWSSGKLIFLKMANGWRNKNWITITQIETTQLQLMHQSIPLNAKGFFIINSQTLLKVRCALEMWMWMNN